jgi:SAM-dependent methyltransferase
MSWDPVWESVFTSREWGRYPPEELVRFVARSYYGAPVRREVRILELGCGPGANIWFLAREGFAAHGIDGSESAVAQARARLAQEGLRAELDVGDFTDLLGRYEPASFDAVVDVAAVQCNRAQAVERCFAHVAQILKPGGKVFSMLVAAGSWGDGLGREVEPSTYVDLPEGPLAGTGLCRFFSQDEVAHVLSPFVDLSVDYSERSLEGGRHTYRHWIATASRPS